MAFIVINRFSWLNGFDDSALQRWGLFMLYLIITVVVSVVDAGRYGHLICATAIGLLMFFCVA